MGRRGALVQKTCPVQERTLYSAKYAESVRKTVGRYPKWKSVAPASMSLDLGLSDAAFRAFCILGLHLSGNVCCTGVRLLGKLKGVEKSQAAEYVEELVRHGYLEKLDRKSGQRARYRITSPAVPNPGVCQGCKARCKDLGEHGQCWLCEAKEARWNSSLENSAG